MWRPEPIRLAAAVTRGCALLPASHARLFVQGEPVQCVALVRLLLAAVFALSSLSGCNDALAPAGPGQALARVNGAEITVLQLNDELQRAGVPPAQQQQASRQLLQALIDRELLRDAAVGEKLERDPKVLSAVERARTLVVAQAYMQRRLEKVAAPTAAEINAYYQAHPSFFSQRKQFSMEQLVLAGADFTPAVRTASDQAGSLDEVARWLDAHRIAYARGQVVRSSADLAPALSNKLLALPKGQLFSVQEGDRAMLVTLVAVRDAPVPLAVARPQIARYLAAGKQQDLAKAELARLRKDAQIDYLHRELAQPHAPLPAPLPAPADAMPDAAARARGVAGLK